jgi:hypothetical protein
MSPRSPFTSTHQPTIRTVLQYIPSIPKLPHRIQKPFHSSSFIIEAPLGNVITYTSSTISNFIPKLQSVAQYYTYYRTFKRITDYHRRISALFFRQRWLIQPNRVGFAKLPSSLPQSFERIAHTPEKASMDQKNCQAAVSSALQLASFDVTSLQILLM